MSSFRKFLVSCVHFGPSFIGLGGMGAKFREQLWMTVTFANRCRGWHYVHSSGFGRLAGLSKEEIEELRDLDTVDLPRKKIVALRYVQHLTINKGELIETRLLREVEELYTKHQVRYIENAYHFTNGINWIGNASYEGLRKLRLVSHTKLKEVEPLKPLDQQGITWASGDCSSSWRD